jgi:hypothetical protein
MKGTLTQSEVTHAITARQSALDLLRSNFRTEVATTLSHLNVMNLFYLSFGLWLKALFVSLLLVLGKQEVSESFPPPLLNSAPIILGCHELRV